MQAECPDALCPILIKFGLLWGRGTKIPQWKTCLTSKLFGLSLMKIDTFDHDWGNIPGFSLGRYFGEQALQSHWVFLIILDVPAWHSSAFSLVALLLSGILCCRTDSLSFSDMFHSDVLYSCLRVWHCHPCSDPSTAFPWAPVLLSCLGSLSSTHHSPS